MGNQIQKKEASKGTAQENVQPSAVQTVQQKRTQALNCKLPTDFTVRERIDKLDYLQVLVSKYSAVKEKEKDMKTFLVEADGSQEHVIFYSGSDEKIRITNTHILKKLVQVVQEEMRNYREGVENEILKFSFEGE